MKNPTNSRKTDSLPHAIGIFSLVLVFLGSSMLTFSYFQHSNAPEQVYNAAPAEVQKPDMFASTTLRAHAAYVYDLTAKKTLYASNPDIQWPLASLTKVATLLAASEVLDPESTIVLPYGTAPTGSAQQLSKGDTWKVQDVMDYTIAASSNEGAEILAGAADAALHARYASSTAQATLWRMNDLTRQLNLSKTYYLNASGLDESATQSGAYGSARDMATLFSYASRFPRLFAATTRPSFTLTSENGATAAVTNTDHALDAIPNIVMGKTGYTDLAGGNLGVVFDEHNHRIVAIVLGSTEEGRFTDMRELVANTAKQLAQ